MTELEAKIQRFRKLFPDAEIYLQMDGSIMIDLNPRYGPLEFQKDWEENQEDLFR